jgi:hypothetical protein
MTSLQITLLALLSGAFIATVILCGLVAIRALTHLNRANQSLYLIARNALDAAPELPDITVNVPSSPPPTVNVEMAQPILDVEPPNGSFTPDAFMVDPTDGVIPNLDVTWERPPGLDEEPDFGFIPDPTET